MLWIGLKSIDMAEGFYFLLRYLKRRAFFFWKSWMPCRGCNMAKSPSFFWFFFFCFKEKRNLSPNFGVIEFFLDLVDFSIYRVAGLLKFSFDQRPLNVRHHVENVFYLKDSRDMASLWDVIRHFISQGGVFNFWKCFEEKKKKKNL